MAGNRNGDRMVRCGTAIVLVGLIYLHDQKENTTHNSSCGQSCGEEVMFYTILSLCSVFSLTDMISTKGFVKWQVDIETEELCLVARTRHSGTRCYGRQGPALLVFELSSCPRPPFRLACPAYYYSLHTECQSSCINLTRRELELGLWIFKDWRWLYQRAIQLH